MVQCEEYDTKCGKIKVYIQGSRSSKDVIITAHDLGCNHNELIKFVSHDSMEHLLNRCMWVHVLIPGQGDNEQDLPNHYTFPTMQQLSEAIGQICDTMGFKHVVVFGDGAGANILARLAMSRPDLVLGAVLIHCTGTAAGLTENLRDRLIGWKLNNLGMNPTAESYLMLHRFGNVSEVVGEVELTQAVDEFRRSLRSAINPKNLNKFIMSFMARTKIIEKVDQMICPVLFMTGTYASHNHTVRRLYNALLNSARNQPARTKHIELIQLDDVGNVLRERPEKVADSLQFFIQGLGLASAAVNRRMSSTVTPAYPRRQSMSMEEYDQPKGVSVCVFDKNRKYSTAFAEGDESAELVQEG